MAENLYRPLEGQKAFRLVHLGPGLSTDVISCSLHYANIDDSPDYEALSYVWGDPRERESIIFNSTDLSVTRNLFQALQTFRLATETRVIWIDALCINQLDNREKNHQVQLMGEIYRRCSRCIAFIRAGQDGDQDISSLLHTLRGLHHTKLPDYVYGSQAKDKDWARSLELPNPDSPTWANLGLLFAAQWFERVWTIQEPILAPRCDLYFGKCSVALNELIAALLALNDFQIVGWTSSGQGRSTTQEINRGQRRLAMFTMILDLSKSTSRNLVRLLYMAQGSQATDPRDKVYGLLGLAHESGSQVKVDYSRSFQEIYKDTAKLLVEMGHGLDLLANAAECADDSSSDLPSWVPNWFIRNHDRNLVPLNPLSVFPHYRVGGTIPSQVVLRDKDQLCVQGKVVDEIIAVTPVFRTKDPTAPRLLQFEKLAAWVQTAKELQGKFAPSDTDDNKNHNASQLCRTLIANRITGKIGPPQAEAYEYFEEFLDFARASKTLRELPDHSRSAWYIEYVRIICRVPRYMMVFQHPGLAFRLFITPGATSYCADMEAACENRRFCRTREGYWGLVPASSEIGDLVCVVLGATCPWALRKESPKSAFRIVGESYIHELPEKGADTGWDFKADDILLC